MIYRNDGLPNASEEVIPCAETLQFVRKASGLNKPSKANEAAFFAAVDEVATASELSEELASKSHTGNRQEVCTTFQRLRAALIHRREMKMYVRR